MCNSGYVRVNYVANSTPGECLKEVDNCKTYSATACTACNDNFKLASGICTALTGDCA